MSATTTVERVNLQSTPLEIDFKTSSNLSGGIGLDFSDALEATQRYPEILITDLILLEKSENERAFKKPDVESVSRCRGIFKLAGDELRYCIAAPGQPRPTGFAAVKGSGHTLVTLKPFTINEKNTVADLRKPERPRRAQPSVPTNASLRRDLERWFFP